MQHKSGKRGAAISLLAIAAIAAILFAVWKARGRASIMGHAWVKMNDGTSNLSRGMKVAICRKSVSVNTMRVAIQESANRWHEEAQEYFAKAKTLRGEIDPIADSYAAREESEGRKASEREKAAQLAISEIESDLDLAKARDIIIRHQHYKARDFESVVIKSVEVASCVVDVDGYYEFKGLPSGDYYLYASCSAAKSFCHWLIPVNSDTGKLDLHNANESP